MTAHRRLPHVLRRLVRPLWSKLLLMIVRAGVASVVIIDPLIAAVVAHPCRDTIDHILIMDLAALDCVGTGVTGIVTAFQAMVRMVKR